MERKESLEREIGQQTVGQLVAQDYRRAQVLTGYGIDFCCGGGRYSG